MSVLGEEEGPAPIVRRGGAAGAAAASSSAVHAGAGAVHKRAYAISYETDPSAAMAVPSLGGDGDGGVSAVSAAGRVRGRGVARGGAGAGAAGGSDDEEDFEGQVAEPIQAAFPGMPSVGDLDAGVAFRLAPAPDKDVDLSALTSLLAPGTQLAEGTGVWTFDGLLRDVSE